MMKRHIVAAESQLDVKETFGSSQLECIIFVKHVTPYKAIILGLGYCAPLANDLVESKVATDSAGSPGQIPAHADFP